MSKSTDTTSSVKLPNGRSVSAIPPGTYTCKTVEIKDGLHTFKIVAGPHTGKTFEIKVFQPKF